MTLAEIASAVDGELVFGSPEAVTSGLSTTDSRQLDQGGIFFAKIGKDEDGHQYLAEALAKGASLAVVSSADRDISLPQIMVKDTVVALSLLAKHVLENIRAAGEITVIGITGSNGKTSTKNMLRDILGQVGPTVAPQGSYNNLVGLPTTVLKADYKTKFLVLEYGAAGRGSIAKLAKWTKPDVSTVLKVGLAHAGVFGGVEQTALIKAELVEYTTKHVVLNFDDPIVRDYRPMDGVTVSGFGFDSEASTRIISTEIGLAGTDVRFKTASGVERVLKLKILGEHQALNAAAALEICSVLGIENTVCFDALENMEFAERWRMQLLESKAGYSVINDAYNASPDSMKAALQTLAVIGRSGHRTVAVLGYMAELGEISDQEHQSIGLLVVRYNIDKLFVVGQDAKLIHMSATAEGSWDGESQFYGSADEAFTKISGMLSPGDVVLVKASNASGLRFLGDKLAGVA